MIPATARVTVKSRTPTERLHSYAGVHDHSHRPELVKARGGWA